MKELPSIREIVKVWTQEWVLRSSASNPHGFDNEITPEMRKEGAITDLFQRFRDLGFEYGYLYERQQAILKMLRIVCIPIKNKPKNQKAWDFHILKDFRAGMAAAYGDVKLDYKTKESDAPVEKDPEKEVPESELPYQLPILREHERDDEEEEFRPVGKEIDRSKLPDSGPIRYSEEMLRLLGGPGKDDGQ